MQGRYLGDVHDYVKFALLRHLQKALKVSIGVNWYLTDPESNGDGGMRGFLEHPEWKSLDDSLFEKLRPYLNPEHRTLWNFERDGILQKNTLYYKCKVSSKEGRTKWHEHAVSALSEAGLIFLDPDNGFEVASMTCRTQHKYALYEEAVEYYQREKIAVGIQFASRRNPEALGKRIRCELAERTSCSREIPVLQAHVTPNILFITICPNNRIEEVSAALESFAAESPFFKWDRKKKKDVRRVELIP